MFLRQDAHPKCCIPVHAGGVPIAQLNRGQLVGPIPEPVHVHVTEGLDGPGDFLERPFMVVSDRMRAALERAGVENIQYFRAHVQQEWSDKPLQGYWLANIVGLVACVNRLESGLDADDVSLLDVPSLVLDSQRSYGLGLFRLAEDPQMIVVASHVQAALSRAGLRGVLLQSPLHYRGGVATSKADLDREP